MSVEFFDNVVLNVDSAGYVHARFICQKCGRTVFDPEDFTVPCSPAGIPLYHLVKFTCKDCYEKEE